MADKVLVVDDDAVLANMVVRLLEGAGVGAEAACSGREALDLLNSPAGPGFGLVVLDVMMPGMDGFEVCRRIRQSSEVPVMFLSAKGEEVDKVCGLTLGADDYVEKPFQPRELVARVQARLRRGSAAEAARGRGTELRAGGVALDPRGHAASVHDVAIALTPKEFDILELLLRRAGEPVGAADIFESCWGESYDDAAANTVMVHIRRLRKKIAEVDSTERPIKTVWGVGYKVEAPRPASASVPPRRGAHEEAS